MLAMILVFSFTISVSLLICKLDAMPDIRNIRQSTYQLRKELISVHTRMKNGTIYLLLFVYFAYTVFCIYNFGLSVQVKKQVSSNKLTFCHRTVSIYCFGLLSTFTTIELHSVGYLIFFACICVYSNIFSLAYAGGMNLQGS